MHHADGCLFFVSVSRDGQYSTGTETNLHKDRLLPDPERRAAQRLHHHTTDHHVCRADQSGLAGHEHKLERKLNKRAASVSAPARRAGQESECKVNVLYKQNQMFKGDLMLLYVLTINLVYSV